MQGMHGGLGFKRTWTCSEFFGLAVRNGRKATGAPGTGELVPGAPADFVTIDLDRLDRDRIMPVDPLELLFARGNASMVRDVVVDGRTVVSEGRCMGVDLPAIEKELRGMYRANAQAVVRLAACVAAAFRQPAKLVRDAAGLPLGDCCIQTVGPNQRHAISIPCQGIKFRLHRMPSKVSCLPNKKLNQRNAHWAFRQRGDVMGALSHLRVVEIGSAAAA